jgi:hypothetical protein
MIQEYVENAQNAKKTNKKIHKKIINHLHFAKKRVYCE